MFCVKLILWSIVAQEGTNILIFYIFEYGAEYGAECSTESGDNSISSFFTEHLWVTTSVINSQKNQIVGLGRFYCCFKLFLKKLSENETSDNFLVFCLVTAHHLQRR